MSDVIGLWSNIHLVCANHPQVEMEIAQGPVSMFYACRKYYPENRDDDEKPCYNRVSLTDFERMLDYLSEMLLEAERNNEMLNLVGKQWSGNGIDFCVLVHETDRLVISVLNNKAIAKIERTLIWN